MPRAIARVARMIPVLLNFAFSRSPGRCSAELIDELGAVTVYRAVDEVGTYLHHVTSVARVAELGVGSGGDRFACVDGEGLRGCVVAGGQ